MRLTRYQCLIGAAGVGAVLVIVLTNGALRWALLAVLFSLTGLLVGLGVSFPRWNLFGSPLCQVRTDLRVGALTFDDGPDPASTPALLDLLARRRIRATFFCVGEQVTRHPQLCRRIAEEGHLVENHSYQHWRWTNLLSVAKLHAELTRAQTAIIQATGRAPVFFRPPMGLTSPRVFRVARDLGLRLVGYSARGFDRRRDSPETIAARLWSGVRPGAILLLHDGGVPAARLTATTTALLDRLEREGYRCLRLDELIACERNNHE